MKKEIILLGVLIMFAMTILLAYTFYTAYSRPEKSVCIDVDRSGEGDIEAYIAMPFVLIVGLITVILTIKGFLRF